MSTKTVIVDPQRVARIAHLLLHAECLPGGYSGHEELIEVGMYVDRYFPLRPREYLCALLHVAKVTREIVRQDKIEAALATPAPAPKPRARKQRRRG
jgi:hypothetical protein